MSVKLEKDQIKVEPDSDEDHDIEQESQYNDAQHIKQEPEMNEDIEIEYENREDQDIKLELESNEDIDDELEYEDDEDQDIKLESESDEDDDIKLETKSDEYQDANVQVPNKYSRPMKFRKGRFIKEEDEIILICHNMYGENFKKMAEFLPGRSSAQCRNRFHILNENSVSTAWRVSEDRKLIKLLGNQTSVDYSGLAQHFPNKNRHHIRSRSITLRKWMKKNPKADISKAPRRASRHLGHGVLSHNLQSAIMRLKTRMESGVKDKKSVRNLTETEIEDAIIVELSQEEHEEEIEEVSMPSDDLDEDQEPPQYNVIDIQNLRKCLTLLRARLDKDKFLESPLSEKYKGLLDQELVPVKKIKCYSRKKTEPKAELNLSTANYWGTKCSSPPSYLFPPNYSTITTLRKMMFFSPELEIKVEASNDNIILQKPHFNIDEKYLFIERFKNLFVWPTLLANQPRQGAQHRHPSIVLPVTLPHFDKGAWNAVAIPKANDKVNNVIDLEGAPSTSNINIDLQSVIETSNFDSMKF